jgi:hypothetical protein
MFESYRESVAMSGAMSGNCNCMSVFTSVVKWSEVVATESEVTGSIPEVTRFSE